MKDLVVEYIVRELKEKKGIVIQIDPRSQPDFQVEVVISILQDFGIIKPLARQTTRRSRKEELIKELSAQGLVDLPTARKLAVIDRKNFITMLIVSMYQRDDCSLSINSRRKKQP